MGCTIKEIDTFAPALEVGEQEASEVIVRRAYNSGKRDVLLKRKKLLLLRSENKKSQR